MKNNNETLLFECACCQKEIQPLTFFDGSIWCPKCRKSLFAEIMKKDVKDAEQDKDDFFGISQELFARYLTSATSNASATEEARAYLRNAIAFCRKSAYKRNPYALLNLGYYYSLGYDESVHMETGRSFARLCFDLAKKYAKDDDELIKLLDGNLKALSTRIEKGGASDLFYLKALRERFDSPIKNASPRIGVFHLSDTMIGTEEKEMIVKLLNQIFDECALYVFNKDKLTKNAFDKISGKPLIKNLVAQANPEDGVWFAYAKKKEPTKEFKSALNKPLKNEDEILENLTSIQADLSRNGSKGVDFSDQDILICTFTTIYDYYSMEKRSSDSPFDRLSACYRDVNLR